MVFSLLLPFFFLLFLLQLKQNSCCVGHQHLLQHIKPQALEQNLHINEALVFPEHVFRKCLYLTFGFMLWFSDIMTWEVVLISCQDENNLFSFFFFLMENTFTLTGRVSSPVLVELWTWISNYQSKMLRIDYHSLERWFLNSSSQK